MTSYCILGSIRVENSRKRELLCFSSDLLEIRYEGGGGGGGGNFDMLITKRRPKLKLENLLSKKLQFSTDFCKNYTKHSLTIVLPWQQWMSHGTDLYSK